MTATFKLQYFIIISVCLYSRFSYCFPYEQLCNGVKIVTYGESCHEPRYLPVTIKEPVPEIVPEPEEAVYQPLKLKYRVSLDDPIHCEQQTEYSVAVQVPEISEPAKIVVPDLYRGKSYGYNIQAPLSSPEPIMTSYNYNLQVPLSPVPETPTPKVIKLLTDLNSRIDRVLVPACEVPAISCKS